MDEIAIPMVFALAGPGLTEISVTNVKLDTRHIQTVMNVTSTITESFQTANVYDTSSYELKK